MGDKNVEVLLHQGIARVIMNRAETGNAMTTEMFRDLREAIEHYGADPAVRVLVIAAKGKHFSVGGSITEFSEMIETDGELHDEILRGAEALSLSIRTCPKPVIAEIRGAAAGAACGLALAADFRIMSKGAKLVTAFAQLAVPGDSFTMYSLCKMLGVSRATQCMMANRVITAEEALQSGIATELAEEDELSAAVSAFAGKLRDGAPLVYAKQKAYIQRFLMKEMEAISDAELEDMKSCSRSENFKEALAAFREKRKAVFN